MQPQPTRRRARPVLMSTMLMMAALTLALLAVAAPLGVAAADEKDEDGPVRRRAEATVAPVVLQVVTETEPETATGGASTASTVFVLDEAIPPPQCPPGFELAQPPLNPELGCIASDLSYTTGSGSAVVVVVGDGESRHPEPECPPGWVPAVSPLNEELGCINNTASGGGGSQHPGHGCPEGYVQKLLLKQNLDGSLTFSYGCVKDGGLTGPADITTGEGRGFVVAQVATGTDVLQVPPCPDGSARHPAYPEYGCIPYGQGPWTP